MASDGFARRAERDSRAAPRRDRAAAEPRAIVHKQILDAAAVRPDAPLAAIADEVSGATVTMVEQVLERYGDPARPDPVDAAADGQADDPDSAADGEAPASESAAETVGVENSVVDGRVADAAEESDEADVPDSDGAAIDTDGSTADAIDADGSTVDAIDTDGSTVDAIDADGAEADLADADERDSDEAEGVPSEADGVDTDADDADEVEAGRDVEPTIDPASLTPQRAETMRAIARRPSATQAELGELLGVAAATISQRVNGIEGFEWSRRRELVSELVAAGAIDPDGAPEADGDGAGRDATSDEKRLASTAPAVDADSDSAAGAVDATDGALETGAIGANSETEAIDADSEIDEAGVDAADAPDGCVDATDSHPGEPGDGAGARDDGSIAGEGPARDDAVADVRGRFDDPAAGGEPVASDAAVSFVDAASAGESAALDGAGDPRTGGEAGGIRDPSAGVEADPIGGPNARSAPDAVAHLADHVDEFSRLADRVDELSRRVEALAGDRTSSGRTPAAGRATAIGRPACFDDPELLHAVLRACFASDAVSADEEVRILRILTTGSDEPTTG